MYAADETYDTASLKGRDPIAAAEFANLERKDTSACPSCGNPEPARLGKGGCEACVDFPRCYFCRRWTDIFPSVRVAFHELGIVVDVCDVCMERAQDDPE